MIKTNNNPPIKILSAIRSYLIANFSLVVRIDKKEKKQLVINKIHAMPVISSIFETSLSFAIFSEVKTIKQKPSKLDDVFKMCCDLFCISYLSIKQLILQN